MKLAGETSSGKKKKKKALRGNTIFWIHADQGSVCLFVCLLDPFIGCPLVPREAQGDRTAGPGTACADANSAPPSAAAGTAGKRDQHPCSQPAGQTLSLSLISLKH